MTQRGVHLADEVLRLIGAELERQRDDLTCTDEQSLTRFAHELRAGASGAERERDERLADAFVRRIAARLAARRVEVRLPRRELRYRRAPMIATVAQSIGAATEERCATLLDLAAAAGAGRALWDEPCDSWLELPDDAVDGRHIAIRVDGDSMTPVLMSRDIILVKLDATPAIDDLVVDRLPDDVFVVKQLTSMRGGRLELSSFNPVFEPIVVCRDRASILGTVVARFLRTS
jgi:SOS-response transcriptional repressor LexA